VRHPTKASAIAVLCVLALLSACNKRPADEALKAAQQALAGAPELATDDPDELAAVSRILGEAHARFEAGYYTDALRAAQPLPDRIAAAVQAAARKKEERARAWKALAAELPARLEAIGARLLVLEAAGVPPERLAAARGDLASLSQAWSEAVEAEKRGDTSRALASGAETKTMAEALAGRLGLKSK
jgi:hypothetical protein